MEFPRTLQPVEGPIPMDRVERVLAGMGGEGVASRALVARGLAPPELPTGLTLALLQGQPRRPKSDGSTRSTAVSGGVWVREQLTLHAPIPLEVPIVISGAQLRRFARKGRIYSTTASETRDARGRLLATNCTTGLERYRADPGLADFARGVAEHDLPVQRPDRDVALANPSLEALRDVRTGDLLVGHPVDITMRRLQARDGPVPSNPIHSDPEAARAAGLDVPIAGGAHVLAFVQEILLQAWGDEALSHGAHLDVRWRQPVRAGTRIVPRAEVIDATDDRLEVSLEVRCDDAPAMVGSAIVPLGSSS